MARNQKRKVSKSSKSTVAVPQAPVAPTPAQWAKMKYYSQFIVTDHGTEEEGEQKEYQFQVGDCVSVLPPVLPEGYGIEDGPAAPVHFMWLGILKDVRVRTGGSLEGPDAWARVQWFFNEEDLREVSKNFDTMHLAENERVLSDHCDVVHFSTIDDIVPMKRFLYDPTYEDIDSSNDATLQRVFHQEEIRAANISALKAAGSEYPDIFYRYDFELANKHLAPKATQFNCFSAKSAKPYLSILGRSDSSSNTPKSRPTVKRPPAHSCFSESVYATPNSKHAQKIGQEVARLVRDCRNVLESRVTAILAKGKEPDVPESRTDESPAGPSSRTRSSTNRNGYITPTSTSTNPSLGTPSQREPSILRLSRSPRKRSSVKSHDAVPDSPSMDPLVDSTAKELFGILQQALLRDDTLTMHVCPRAQCSAPRGRAWHRSCLIRDQVKAGGGTDEEVADIDFDDIGKSLDDLQRWISGASRQKNIPSSSPSYEQVLSQWDGMGNSEKAAVQRTIQLLACIPPGYIGSSSMNNEQGQYEFPVQTRLDAPPQESASLAGLGRGKGKGKMKVRSSEEEVIEDLLLEKRKANSRSRSRTKRATMDVDSREASQSPKKRRRSSRTLRGAVDEDAMDIDGEATAGPSSRPPGNEPSNDDDDGEEESIVRIMHSLAHLRAPELVCLASQPMVRGGVPSDPSFSLSDTYPILGTSAMFNSNSPFGMAPRTTITGNISQVTDARIKMFKTLDGKLPGEDEMDADGDELMIPMEWADYVVELEGREWLFEWCYGGSMDAARVERKGADKSGSISVSSRDAIRKRVLARTHQFLYHWQLQRRKFVLCPNCRSSI